MQSVYRKATPLYDIDQKERQADLQKPSSSFSEQISLIPTAAVNGNCAYYGDSKIMQFLCKLTIVAQSRFMLAVISSIHCKMDRKWKHG